MTKKLLSAIVLGALVSTTCQASEYPDSYHEQCSEQLGLADSGGFLAGLFSSKTIDPQTRRCLEELKQKADYQALDDQYSLGQISDEEFRALAGQTKISGYTSLTSFEDASVEAVDETAARSKNQPKIDVLKGYTIVRGAAK
jgi:hypothetical protein